MPLPFVFDESLLGLCDAVRRYSIRIGLPLDAVAGGDPPDHPYGTKDPDLLRWTEKEDRILVCTDRQTMPLHLEAHFQSGHHTPGVILIGPNASLLPLIEYLVLVAYASDPQEWRDRIEYIR